MPRSLASRLSLCLVIITGLTAGPALAQVPPPPGVMAIAVGETTATGDPDWVAAGRGLGDLLINDLLALKEPGQPHADCPFMLVEWRRRAEIIAEIEFQQSEYVDAATRVTPGQLIEPTVMITGASSVVDGKLDYTLEMRSHPDGELIAKVEGSVDPDKIFDHTEQIANDMLDQICKPKSWHIRASYNDLTLDDDVCDITRPFSMNGKGQAAGIRFDFVPAGAAGTFSVSGLAAGVRWSGAGSIATATNGETGEFSIIGSWQITSPMGVFSDSGTIPGNMTRIAPCG